MRIEKLEIKGFGRLKNVSVTLDKGVNIVFGGNEAGKSTMQWFIKAMFFGLKGGKASKEGLLPPLKRYKPWSGEDYAGFLEYRLDDGQIFRIGRNFSSNSARVFDSLFNDITNTFEVSREKGINLAERHLGLNELCFDKTVFVRQMEAKVGEDGSKELYNRIINISETGFEDISFKKAQEALKNALKNHVGTDKTSTRPLDKVVYRLNELKAKREELINRRASLFTVENDLNEAIILRNNLQNRKTFLEKARDLEDLQNRLKKHTQLLNQAWEILENIQSDEKELMLIEEQSADYCKSREEFKIFSLFDDDDIEELDRNYLKLMDKVNEQRKLLSQITAKEKEIDINREIISAAMAFSELGEGVENKVIDIAKELEQLKRDYEKGNLDSLNKKIESVKKRVGSYKLGIIISSVAALVLAGLGFTVTKAGYAGAMAGFLLALVLVYFKNSSWRELSNLLDEKRISFISINGIKEEISRKQNTLNSIYMKVRASGLEDFLRLKAEYDAESRVIAALNGEVNRLESERAIVEREISIYKGKILSKLAEAEIIDNGQREFEEEHIKSFKDGVRSCKGIEPGIRYTSQRLEDVNKRIEKHYKSAAAVCGGECVDKDGLKNKIDMLTAECEMLNDQISEKTDLAEQYQDVEEDYKKVCSELESTVLNIREYETLLRGTSSDESELQRIEEELEELEGKKNRLEDINASLKIALEVLTEASQEIQKDFVPLLNNKMTEAVKRVTAGKYYDLRADSTLSLNVISPETGEIVPVSALSGGTADQMYLALRISAADMISQKGEKLPLILDEVFAQYDDIRTKDTFEFLKELSKQRQIIFFTCKGREVEIAKQMLSDVNIIELK